MKYYNYVNCESYTFLLVSAKGKSGGCNEAKKLKPLKGTFRSYVESTYQISTSQAKLAMKEGRAV